MSFTDLIRFSGPAILVVLLLAGCARTRTAAPPTAESTTEKPDGESDDGFKKYSEVITDEAETDSGLFAVHQLDEKLFYEIPDSMLDREMLMVTRLSATANNLNYGGMKTNTQVLRWQQQDKKILLRVVSYENVADEDKPIYQAVRELKF